jgi:nitric oxide reductase NorD protein
VSTRTSRLLRRWSRRLREALAALRHRLPARAAEPVVTLETVRAQLEYYLRALYDLGLSIEPAAPDRPDRNWLARGRARLGGAPAPTRSERVGHRILLPAALPASANGIGAAARYRLLAAQHAERVVRRSAAQLAPDASALEHDLFEIADAAAVDRALVRAQPGLAGALADARRSGLADRKGIVRHMALERDVESLLRDTLVANAPTESSVPDAAACAAWARATAAALAAQHLPVELSAYRGMRPLMLWNTMIVSRAAERTDAASAQPLRASPDAPTEARGTRRRQRPLVPPPAARTAADDTSSESAVSATREGNAEDDGSPPPPDAVESLRAGPRDDQSSDGIGLGPSRAARAGDRAGVRPPGIRYPEWDLYANAYRADAAIVRVLPGAASPSGWADRMLREHAVLVRQLRRQFDQMRVDRAHLTRQWRGEELDLDTCVAALVDRRMGRAPDERLYTIVRPGHRPLALALLVDVSASTGDAAAGGELRVIDVERLALLVAAEALEALGNEWAAFAFASDGDADVRVTTLKAFTERNAALVRERVSALEPAGATRLGAAIRHATRELVQRPVAHRLIVILSDGKPNDRDRYSIDYAVADSRRAVMEARLAGVHTHCITVDPNEPEAYMSDIFGETGYLLVARPAQLPRALAGAVQRLVS